MAPTWKEHEERERGMDVRRRDFLTGVFRPRNLALACFGWNEDDGISSDFTAPTRAPEIPEWKGGMDRILEQMDDLTGIEEP